MKYLGLFLIIVLFFYAPGLAFATNTKSSVYVRTSSQYARVLNNLGISSGGHTIELWVYITTAPASGTYYMITGLGNGTAHTETFIYYANPSGTLRITAGQNKCGVTGVSVDLAHTLTVNTWYHLVITYDGTNVRLYEATAGGSHSLLGTSAALSGDGTSGCSDYLASAMVSDGTSTFAPNAPHYYDGYIDDLRVWNTVRSTTEMDANFEKELTGSESGLVAYYKFADNWNDTTSGGYNMTAVNTPTFTTTVPFLDTSPNPLNNCYNATNNGSTVINGGGVVVGTTGNCL